MNSSNNNIDQRAQLLADNLLRGTKLLANFASNLTEEEWHSPVDVNGDSRTYGLVIHHVASVYPVEIQLARVIASGNPILDVTVAGINEMNAQHANEFALVEKDETLRLLKNNSEEAAKSIREFSNEQLQNCQPISLYGNAPLTTQFFIEDHAVRHSFHHLSKLKEALSR